MSRVEKIDVKMTFKVSEEDRKTFKADMPALNNLLNRKPDDEIKMSMVVRAAIRNLHESIGRGSVPQWLIDYALSGPPKKTKPKRPKG